MFRLCFAADVVKLVKIYTPVFEGEIAGDLGALDGFASQRGLVTVTVEIPLRWVAMSASGAKSRATCAHCGKEEALLEVDLKKCLRCKRVAYCGRE